MSTHRHNKIKYHKILINVSFNIFNVGELFNTMILILGKITYIYISVYVGHYTKYEYMNYLTSKVF